MKRDIVRDIVRKYLQTERVIKRRSLCLLYYWI